MIALKGRKIYDCVQDKRTARILGAHKSQIASLVYWVLLEQIQSLLIDMHLLIILKVGQRYHFWQILVDVNKFCYFRSLQVKIDLFF